MSSPPPPPPPPPPPTGVAPPRSLLRAQARIWRPLMRIGMYLHSLPAPWPSRPSFERSIDVVEPFLPGRVTLQFYAPPSYARRPAGRRYPILLNFHGGGFTIGRATDDARWFHVAIEQLDCVVCSVDYRLAPEFPYPTGVQDGVAAMHWLQEHAVELGLDPARVITSGFSAGGNFCFTVAMKYRAEVEAKRRLSAAPTSGEKATGIPATGRLRVLAAAAFYPAVDFSKGRAHRRATNPSAAHELPAYLTDLFDAAYLHPSAAIDLADPFLSPAVAPDELLVALLPPDIVIHTCEFDGLAEEGRLFARRLEALGKRVFHREIPGVAHAFDRHPALRIPPSVRACYMDVCAVLKGLLAESEALPDPVPVVPVPGPETGPAPEVEAEAGRVAHG